MPDSRDDRKLSQPQMPSYVISPQVKMKMEAKPDLRLPVIVCLVDHPGVGVAAAKKALLEDMLAELPKAARIRESDFYVFASLLPGEIRKMANHKSVYQIWPDERSEAHMIDSVKTIKAPACWRTFEAYGKGITWAVMDTGIRSDHPHFQTYKNINTQLSVNYSNSPDEDLVSGHGTHVAGIIAGIAPQSDKPYLAAMAMEGETAPRIQPLDGCPSGIAAMATLISVKVLDDDGFGTASTAILGLEYLRRMNQGTQRIAVDGVNMSLGYPFDPKWYGCGHSPLCDEVRRTVDSGIIVVISCGNEGYGTVRLDTGKEVPLYLQLSIADPANTEEAIAVGSVHKSKPHHYGVTYFSSKGPTGDGRIKPDLVAPGEKVISCSLRFDSPDEARKCHYEERSGTSMAAPHVSGAIAAFLSVHKEFRGDPERVKSVFLKSATDLGRERTFQGAGLVDALRAMMSV